MNVCISLKQNKHNLLTRITKYLNLVLFSTKYKNQSYLLGYTFTKKNYNLKFSF